MIKSFCTKYFVFLQWILTLLFLSGQLWGQETLTIELWDSSINQSVPNALVILNGAPAPEGKKEFVSNGQGRVTIQGFTREVNVLTCMAEGYHRFTTVLQAGSPNRRFYLSPQSDSLVEQNGHQNISSTSLPVQRDMKNPPQRSDPPSGVNLSADLPGLLGTSTSRRTFSLSRLPHQFDGWTIEIHAGSQLLPEDPLLKKADHIFWYRNKDRTYAYFVGDFETYEEAFKAFEEHFAQDFPGAIIMQFVNGKRQ